MRKIRLLYVADGATEDPDNWSGTPYFLGKGLEGKCELVRLDSAGLKTGFYDRCYMSALKRLGKAVVWNYREATTIAAAKQIEEMFNEYHCDAVLTTSQQLIANLPTNIPGYAVSDATITSFIGNFGSDSKFLKRSLREARHVEQKCLDRARIVFFASEWAAKEAERDYSLRVEKARIIPFGASVSGLTMTELDATLPIRCLDGIKILFVGTNWEWKGGDEVVEVCKSLRAMGHNVKLTIVGSTPPTEVSSLDWVMTLGYISKRTKDGIEKIDRLFRSSDLLMVLTKSECYGIVFAEASAYGLPSISRNVGGVGTAILHGQTGLTFGVDVSPHNIAVSISELVADQSTYQRFCRDALSRFHNELNWDSIADNILDNIVNDLGTFPNAANGSGKFYLEN